MTVFRPFVFASVLLSSVALANASLAAGDNCQNVKDGVTQEWGAVAWGPVFGCYAATPALALQDAGPACIALLTQGVIGHAEQREVHLWLGGPPSATLEYARTYLGYCRGNRPATTLDPGKAKEEREALEAKIKK